MRRLNWILAGVCAISLITAATMWFELLAQRERNEALQSRVTALAALPAPPASPAQVVAPHSAANEPGALGGKRSDAALSAKPAVTLQDAYEESMEQERRLLANPRYRDAKRAETRLQYGQWRDDAIHIVGLTPEQADKIVDVLVERQIDGSSRASPRNAEDMAQYKRQLDEDQRRDDAAIRELVGDAKADQLHQYHDSLQSRSEVRQLRARLASDGDPLRPDQVEPLIAALHVERAQLDQDIQDYNHSLNWDEASAPASQQRLEKRAHELRTAAQERSLAAAAAILSPAQLKAFESQRARELQMQEAYEKMDWLRRETLDPVKTQSN